MKTVTLLSFYNAAARTLAKHKFSIDKFELEVMFHLNKEKRTEFTVRYVMPTRLMLDLDLSLRSVYGYGSTSLDAIKDFERAIKDHPDYVPSNLPSPSVCVAKEN